MTLHCMIDIETLDTTPTAVVLSIGAVLFDPNGSYIGDDFYVKLATDEQFKCGRTKSQRTMEWWAQQSQAAQDEAFGLTGKLAAVYALTDFRKYINDATINHTLPGVWGNGSDFDNVIVANLYRSFGLESPWPFWKNRCFRTLKELHLPKEFIKPQRRGTHHNALDDAIYQAEYLQAVVKATGMRL